MKISGTLARVAGAGATFATFALTAMPVMATGYDYYYSSANDAASLGFLGAYSFVWCLACCIPFLISAVLAYIVYKDAKKNNVENGALWAIVTFLFSVIGLLVYYLAIRPEALKKSGGSVSDTTSRPSEPTNS